MITFGFVAPAVAALLAGLAAGLLGRNSRPATTTKLLTALAAVTASSAVVLVTLFASLYALQSTFLAAGTGWCLTLTGGHEVPWWLGMAAAVALFAMAVSAGNAWRRLRPAVVGGGGAGGLVVLPDAEPTAFAVPGAPGQVVVSRGMLQRLDADERRVLLAHERAHLRCHHHRYLRIASLAAAVAPPLQPLRARIRHATERWADEEAAGEVGDRRLVARTIARAALAQSATTAPALGLAGLGVRSRIDALLDDPARRQTLHPVALLGFAVAVVGLGSASMQVHHVGEFIRHICHV